MSWQSVEAVIKHSRSSGATRHVLIVIAYHANSEGGCSFPGVATIMAEGNIGERSVWSGLKWLIEHGELSGGSGCLATRENPYSVLLPHGEDQPEILPVSATSEPASAEATAKYAVEEVTANIAPPVLLQNMQPLLQDMQSDGAKYAVAALQNMQQEESVLRVNINVLETPTRVAGAHTRGEAASAAAASVGSVGPPLLREAIRGAVERDIEAVSAASGQWYGDFGAFWKALKLVYPKQGLVDMRDAEALALSGFDPAHWPRIVQAAGHYAKSSTVLRGKVRNLANWLQGDSWLPYEDGPIVDQPQQHSREPTQAQLEQRGIHELAEQARGYLRNLDMERSNNGYGSSKANGNGDTGLDAVRQRGVHRANGHNPAIPGSLLSFPGEEARPGRVRGRDG